MKPRAAPFLGSDMKCGIFWAEDEPSLQFPADLGTTVLPGNAKHLHHTLCTSQPGRSIHGRNVIITLLSAKIRM